MSMSKTAIQNTVLKQRVMVVDDHPIVRQGLAQLINQETDIEVCCEAEDMKDALQRFGKCKPDVAIIDIALGQTSGVRLIEQLSQKYHEVPILALSMHDESLYAERCLRAGAKGYIMKKEPPEKVISALRKILDGEIYVSDNLGTKLLHKFIARQPGAYSSPIEQLSNRELEVYEFIGQGLKTREIAERLSLSVKTIETYIDHIKKKMNFRDSRDLFRHAVQWSMGEEPG
jgi:DNA-binding NarL/FixJ family response regulator